MIKYYGVPPGSGGEELVSHPCGCQQTLEDFVWPGSACDCGKRYSWAKVVGVRFPADDPDPGRWYRGKKD